MTALKARPPKEVTPGHCRGELFGRPAAGKTWFALAFPSPYYIDTEGGARLAHYMKRLEQSGGAYFGQEDGAADFGEILNQVKALATEKHKYRTLVIDSITKIYQLAIAKEHERLQAKFGEISFYGSEKKPAIGHMRRLIGWLLKLDMNVWFIAHQIGEWTTVKGERKETGVGPDVWPTLQHELDLVLNIEHVSPGFRVATVKKTRLLGFPEFDRFTIQDGDKEDLGYTEFAARYGKDYIEAEAKPIVLATHEQLTEIARLTSILKLNDDDIDKVLTKAGAESVSELDIQQAAKFVMWLRNKLKVNENGSN